MYYRYFLEYLGFYLSYSYFLDFIVLLNIWKDRNALGAH
jgi:hypothetical protein